MRTRNRERKKPRKDCLSPAAFTFLTKALLLALLLTPTLWLLGAAALSLVRSVESGHPLWDVAARRAYGNSLEIASCAACCSLLVGLPYGWWMARVRTRARRWMAALSLPPLLLPPYAHALAWILLLNREGPVANWASRIGWPSPSPGLGRPLTAALVLTAAFWPVCAWFTAVATRSAPADLEDAARLETSEQRAAWLAAAPYLRVALLAAALLVFLLSLADFGVPNALGVSAYPRELADRFNAEYDFGDAVRLALPMLLAALPLAWLNLRILARVEFAPAESAGARRIGGGYWAVPCVVACTLAIGLGVVAPLASLAAYSMRGEVHARVWQEAIEPLWNSAWLGAASIALAVAFSLALSRLHAALDLLVTLPYAFPGSLVAIAVIALLNRPGFVGEIYGTTAPLVWVYLVLFFPFAHRAIAPGWRRVDPDLMGEALLAGAGAWTRFRAIAWPALAPYAALGAALVFLLSAREMDATSLLRVPGLQTLAFKIQDYLHFYPVPNVAALCLVLVLAQLIAVSVVAALVRWRSVER